MMKTNWYLTIIIAVCFSGLHCQPEKTSKVYKADVIVYGGTSSAVTTAV
ncbi:MAG: hypothetical protein IMZ64_13835, partial [Bacteroidetes bacterium]|nr:hypothetical protein [Bacteroidota bacterium]